MLTYAGVWQVVYRQVRSIWTPKKKTDERKGQQQKLDVIALLAAAWHNAIALLHFTFFSLLLLLIFTSFSKNLAFCE